jgi:hypothetical protein
VADTQSTLKLANGRGQMFVAASDTITAIQATSETAKASLYARSGDATDAGVTTSVGDKVVSLTATNKKAELDHVKH